MERGGRNNSKNYIPTTVLNALWKETGKDSVGKFWLDDEVLCCRQVVSQGGPGKRVMDLRMNKYLKRLMMAMDKGTGVISGGA